MVWKYGYLTGCHEFPSHTVFRKCEHPVLTGDRDREYFKEGDCDHQIARLATKVYLINLLINIAHPRLADYDTLWGNGWKSFPKSDEIESGQIRF